MASDHYDVVVIGGGSAGIAAAAGSSRAGARTLLVEKMGFLGGSATNASVLAYCGLYAQGERPRPVVGGVGQEVVAALHQLGVMVAPQRGGSGNWVMHLDPEALKLALDRVVARAGVELLLHASLVACDSSGGRITGIRVQDHQGIREITAGRFVDASGEGDLSAMLGIAAAPEGHVAPGSYPIRLGGVPPDTAFSKEAMAAAVAAYNAARPDRPIERVSGGYSTRLPHSRDLWWLVVDVETDGLSAPSLTAAERDGRETAWRLVEALRTVPGFERAFVASTGPQVGIRQSRSTRAREHLSGSEAEVGRRRADGVALGGWPIELHHGAGKVEFRPIGGEGFFDIPLGCLMAEGVDNLWLGGRLIGTDPVAFGSIRVMGTAFATGHAAGVAAALGAGVADSARVRHELERQSAILG